MMASVPNRDPLSNLIGGGGSKVGISGAMRARDVAQPSAEDLAAAERELVIKHAAPRADTRPLPKGIAPADLPDERLRERADGPSRPHARKHPRPGPPPSS
jgi:hypothetical protein